MKFSELSSNIEILEVSFGSWKVQGNGKKIWSPNYVVQFTMESMKKN